MLNILIIGANSAIARSVARLYAVRHERLFLVARNETLLQEQTHDLQIRGAEIAGSAVLDVTDFDRHGEVVRLAAEALGGIDVALICHGTLPDQANCEHNFERIRQEIDTNALSVISLLTHLSPVLISQNAGTLAVITSVAGDRGRQSNYIYGAAKSLVSRYLEGLRGSLFKHQVHVVDIRPGFVDTPMTQSVKKGLLWAQPDSVAISIVKGIDAGKNTLYVPWFWQFIMLIVKIIPESVFKRLKF